MKSELELCYNFLSKLDPFAYDERGAYNLRGYSILLLQNDFKLVQSLKDCTWLQICINGTTTANYNDQYRRFIINSSSVRFFVPKPEISFEFDAIPSHCDIDSYYFQQSTIQNIPASMEEMNIIYQISNILKNIKEANAGT